MAIINPYIYPDGDGTQLSGIGLHLYSGGMHKYGVDLFIELQRAPEVSGSPGTYATIRTFPAAPTAYMDIANEVKRLAAGDDRDYYYRARMVAVGLTPSAWSSVDVGNPRDYNSSYTLPPVPSYPKIGIDQREVPNDPTKASVTLRATPQHADTVIKYQVLADAASIPARSDGSWLTYSGAFLVTRSDVAVKKVVAWGELNGIIGNFYSAEIATDRVPVVLNITLTVDADGVANMEVTTDADAGSIRYAYSTSAYPDKTTTQSGTIANGRNITVNDVTNPTPLTDGQTLYVSVLPYSQTGGAGIEGDLSRAQITFEPGVPANSIQNAYILSKADIVRLYVNGNSGVASFKWAAQTGSFPAAGTGTCVNASTAQVDVTSTISTYGTVYYITVTPYSAASCGGTTGAAFQFTFERQWESGFFNDDTGWLGDPSILAQKTFENDASALLTVSADSVGNLTQPPSYSPTDDNERTFWDKQDKHVPNQSVWGAGSLYAGQARFQFSVKALTAGDTLYHKIFALGDLSDGTFWNGSTGNGIWIEYGDTNGNRAKVYKRVAGVNTQIGSYMQVTENWTSDYVEFDIIVYDFNPVQFIVGINGKFQVFADAGNPNMSSGFYFGLIADETMDNVFRNVSGRSQVGTNFAKKLVVGDLSTMGTLDATREDAIVAGVSPMFRLYETDAPTNEKIWNLFMAGGDLFIGQENDAESSNLKIVGFSNAAGIIQEIMFAVSTTGTGAVVFTQAPTGVSFLGLSPYPNCPIITAGGYIGSYQVGAAADEKRWVWGVDSGNDWVIKTITDAAGAGVTALTFTRGTGTAITQATFTVPLVYSGTIDNPLRFTMTDSAWGYISWYNVTPLRKAYVGPSSDMSQFLIGLENGCTQVVITGGSLGWGGGAQIASSNDVLSFPIANATWATWRNAGDTANINILRLSSGDNTELNADAGNHISIMMAGAETARFDTAGLNLVAGDVLKWLTNATGNRITLWNTDYGIALGTTAIQFYLPTHTARIEILHDGAAGAKHGEVWPMHSVRGIAATALVVGDVVFLDSSSSDPRWVGADADLAAFTGHKVPLIGVVRTAAAAGGDEISVCLFGGDTNDDNLDNCVLVDKGAESWTTADFGLPVYLTTTATVVSKTAPTATGSIVYVVGHIVSTSGHIVVWPQYLYKNA